jgi:anti-anti-sigma regulatory factor
MSVSWNPFSSQATTPAARTAGQRVPLEVRLERDGCGLVVQLFGDFDRTSRRVFERRLASARRQPSSWLILDLSGLDAVDTSGIDALMEMAREEPRLLLLRGPHQVHRQFVQLGADRLLPFID